MAGGKSQYLEQALLDFLYRAQPYTPPGTAYLALSNDPWDPTMDGSSLVEPTGGGYARTPITSDTSTWLAPDGALPAQIASSNDLTLPTATGDWGLVQSVYLTDASSGGNCLHGTDVTPVAFGTGSSPLFLAGQLVVQEG